MILVDASVLIDFLRTQEAKLATLFATLPLTVCGLTWSEILAGSRGPAHRQRLLAFLNSFGTTPIPEGVWDDVGDNLTRLRVSGLTIPFQDVVVAAVALDADIELWARDQHYPMMKTVFPALRLFVEPP